jgi:GT2 family glycosyltransferase
VSVAAVVVSYNRRDLLRETLEALRAQTRTPDEIIVVDNASTDGTAQMLAADYAEVSRYITEENLGGAGGFALGVDLAMRAGHTDAWLMDDDAVPHRDGLERLLAAGERIARARPHEPRPGFLTSRILKPDGSPLSIWLPQPIPGEVAPAPGVTPLPWSPFVGVLVNLDLGRQTFLPMADFFIWLDDLEYTARLGVISTGFVVEDAFITHPDKSYVKGDFGWRFEHVLKNRLWIIRRRDLARRSVKSGLAMQVVRAIPGQAVRSQSKRAYLASLRSGLRRGLLEAPTYRRPGEAIAGPTALAAHPQG